VCVNVVVVYVRTALELFMNPMGKALNVSQCFCHRGTPEYLIPCALPLCWAPSPLFTDQVEASRGSGSW